MSKYSPALLFLPALLGIAAILVWGWPGGVSIDMRVVVEEGRYFRFDGHQEPMFGLLWAGVQALMPANVALVGCFVLQVVGFFLAFAWIARDALRSGSVTTALLASVAGFLPPLTCFSVMVESNIITGVAWLLAVALCASAKSRAGLVFAGVLLWYGFVARSGMILAIVPVGFACVRLARPNLGAWRALGFAVALGVGFQGVSFGVTQWFLGAPTRDRVLAVSQLFDMGGVYERTGTHYVPEFIVTPGHRAEEVLALYEPVLCSSMFWRGDNKPVFRLPMNKDEGRAIREAWIETIRNHPMAWLEVKARYAALFLMIGVDWAFDYWASYAANREFGLAERTDFQTGPIGVYANRTAMSVLWKGWFWLLVSGAVVLVSMARRGARSLPAAALYVGALATIAPHLLFGQGALARYYFLPYSLLVLALLLALPGALARKRSVAPPLEEQPAAT